MAAARGIVPSAKACRNAGADRYSQPPSQSASRATGVDGKIDGVCGVAGIVTAQPEVMFFAEFKLVTAATTHRDIDLEGIWSLGFRVFLTACLAMIELCLHSFARYRFHGIISDGSARRNSGAKF